MQFGMAGLALLGAMSASPAVSIELNFNQKTTLALMQRCRAESPPMKPAECLKYLQGVTEGYCLASNATVAEARTCTSEKYREVQATVESIKAEKNRQPD